MFIKKYTTALMLVTQFLISNCENFDDADYEADEDHCYYNPSRLFYQNHETGVICCRGKILPMVTASEMKPEMTGDCAISTKTAKNGTLDSSQLWCSYSCEAKKKGLLNSKGEIKTEEYFKYLSTSLSDGSKKKLKLIMEKHLGCWNIHKHAKESCYSPLIFHKCWTDAVEYLCTHGMPKDNDFSKITKSKFDYANMELSCYVNEKRTMPGCCHGKPLPWLISEVVHAPKNREKYTKCLSNLGNDTMCSATCFLNSIGIIDDSMEINVKEFEKHIFKFFPMVHSSTWMNYLGPTFAFFDELKVDITGGLQETRGLIHRVCEFHRTVLELHLNKMEMYCEMTSEELEKIVKKSSEKSS